jgi:hypothetical protein
MQLFKFKENQMAKKLTRAEKIRRYIRDNPTAKTVDIAAHFETRYQNVYAVRRKMETPMIAKAKKSNWEQLSLFKSDKSIMPHTQRLVELTGAIADNIKRNQAMQVEMFEPKSDTVNHPAHYKVGGIETIDFIEAKNLGYNLGNVVKYITRADHKGNKLEDLRKAQWYLTRAIETAK